MVVNIYSVYICFTEGRSGVLYTYLILIKYIGLVGDSPGCCQGQQDDFPQPSCALILHRNHP